MFPRRFSSSFHHCCCRRRHLGCCGAVLAVIHLPASHPSNVGHSWASINVSSAANALNNVPSALVSVPPSCSPSFTPPLAGFVPAAPPLPASHHPTSHFRQRPLPPCRLLLPSPLCPGVSCCHHPRRPSPSRIPSVTPAVFRLPSTILSALSTLAIVVLAVLHLPAPCLKYLPTEHRLNISDVGDVHCIVGLLLSSPCTSCVPPSTSFSMYLQPLFF